MTWRNCKVEEHRNFFIEDYLKGKFNLSELCRQYTISRPCAYKWIKAYEERGFEGLKDRSRAPIFSPTETSPDLVKKILQAKREWSRWGPKKIHAYLVKTFQDLKWPSKTTVENILKKNGLVERRKLRKRFANKTDPLGECNNFNDVWCFDFKGWWLTKDKYRCEPFTVTDAHSRFLLGCEKLTSNSTDHVWSVFDRLFREFGLPLRVRSDNGPPFASNGPARLSKLSINFLKAGIKPEMIQPGHPEENGRHERMHLTLKNEGVDLDCNLDLQLQKFEDFLEYYNFIRPHEALNQKCPGEIYIPSPRYWDGKLRSPEYPTNFRVTGVDNSGKFRWKGRQVYVGRAFEGEPIGILHNKDEYELYYGTIHLGKIKENNIEFERSPGRIR